MIKIAMIILFFAVMVFVGVYSKKKATNVCDFVLGGRAVGPWLTAFAFGTSYFSAVVFVGYAGQFGWKFGLSSTWIGLGNALIGSLLAWIVLGKRTRIMTKHLDAATMPEFFGKRYKCKYIRIVSSVIAFVFLVPYTASVYNGLSYLFEMAFDIKFKYCVIVMAVLTAVYVLLGGYMATAINDFIQGIIMLGGIAAVVICTLQKKGGLLSAVEQMSKVKPSKLDLFQGSEGVFTSIFGPTPLALLSVVVLTSLGTWGLPQMVHKFYTIKDDKAIQTGTIISTIFALVVAGGCYFLGGFARLFDSELIHTDKGIMFDRIIPSMINTLPEMLIGIVIVLVLSASMSTLASLVITSSSTITLDVIKGNIIKDMREKTQLICIRVLVVVFIVLSVVLSITPTIDIAGLMSISWGALAGSFLAPFLLGLYWKKTTKISVWASFFTGLFVTVGNMLAGNIVSPLDAGAISMVGSVVVGVIVSLVTPKMSDSEVEEIFSCYNNKLAHDKKMEEKEDTTKENEEEICVKAAE